MRAVPWVLRVLWLIAGAAVCACVAYDHRWVQQAQEKQRARARLRPATLQRAGPGVAPDQSRTLQARAWATRAYAAETLNWEGRFEELLEDANAVLGPALGLRIENSGASLWRPESAEDRLDDVLDEMAEHDLGADVGWVVGFVKSTPHLVFDQHALGVGRVLSKYLVVRASNDPRELELLSKEYYNLSEDEVAKLHTDRKRHRMTAVFLHEIGHTLGARHRQAARTLMNPTYDPEHSGFDEGTLGLLRITAGKDLGALSDETYSAVRQYYEQNAEGWVPSERESTLRWLAALSRPEQGKTTVPTSSATAKTNAAPAQGPPLPLTTLKRDDRARYDSALQAETHGQLHEAWKIVLPLIEPHDRVLEVQELRCRLARHQNLFPSVEEAHCAPAELLRAAATQ